MTVDVCVIGAGIVGITTALELCDRGIEVVLVDRVAPGTETSYGNAGVLSVSTVLNVNNPGLLRRLPSLLLGRVPYFDYDLRYALSQVDWLIQFFSRARQRYVIPTARAIQALQRLSIDRHRHYIMRSGQEHAFVERGWLKVYEEGRDYASSEIERKILAEFGVKYQELDASGIRQLEPGLTTSFENGIWLSETCSVQSPLILSQAYFRLFKESGGQFQTMDVSSLQSKGDWRIGGRDGSAVHARNIVLTCGPWSPDICQFLGLKIPMAWERGYHFHLTSPLIGLRRPVFVARDGFLMAPQGNVTRITSGVEFAHRDASPKYRQIFRAIEAARGYAEFGADSDVRPWLGSRPTMPDGMPVIGGSKSSSGLWFNFGHQHIGMSTSTGSAVVLANQLTGSSYCEIDMAPYSPARFGI